MTRRKETIRPKCSHDNCDNVTMKKGKTKFGFIIWGKFCRTHHLKFYSKGHKSIKLYVIHKKDKCEMCDFVPTHSCQLDVDHIDGNHNNNGLENLQTLCANCHRLKTYKDRNYDSNKASSPTFN